MTGRKQEFNLQIYQITDAILLAFAFWAAHFLRQLGQYWFDLEPIGLFAESQWMIFIIMPFGPILLELQGFYTHPLQKTLGISLRQMASAAFWIILLVGACVIFFRLQVPSRAVLPLFGILALGLLTLRERITISLFRTRARNGSNREPVLLAGSPVSRRSARRSPRCS